MRYYITTLFVIFLVFTFIVPLIAYVNNKNCSDFNTWREAQDYFEESGGSHTHNIDGLDQNRDGFVCLMLPGVPSTYLNPNNSKEINHVTTQIISRQKVYASEHKDVSLHQPSTYTNAMMFAMIVFTILVIGFLSRKSI